MPPPVPGDDDYVSDVDTDEEPRRQARTAEATAALIFAALEVPAGQRGATAPEAEESVVSG